MATPSQEYNLELAREGLGAWVEGDMEGTLARLTEDVEVYVPPELVNAGSYRGKQEFLEWTQQWDEAWSEFSSEVEDLVPVGERHVVATVRGRGRGRGSGIEVENVLGWVLGVRDDFCEYLSLQPSRSAALELARQRESALHSA